MTIYRPPNQSPEGGETLFGLMRKLAQNENALLTGDFYTSLINWDELSVKGSHEPFSSRFLKLTGDLSVVQNFGFPTRIKEAQTANCLDLVLSKDPIDTSEIRPIAPLGKSDNVMILWEYSSKTNQLRNTEF